MEEDSVLECPECGFAVETQEIAKYSGQPEVDNQVDGLDSSEVSTTANYFVLRCCPKCKSPFLHRYKYYNHCEAGSFLQDAEQLYPTDKETEIKLGAIPTIVNTTPTYSLI